MTGAAHPGGVFFLWERLKPLPQPDYSSTPMWPPTLSSPTAKLALTAKVAPAAGTNSRVVPNHSLRGSAGKSAAVRPAIFS